MFDYTIIGSGIVGLATAYHLQQQHPAAKMCIVDKEDRPAYHQTGRNSGVIHSGVYYQPGSLKAKNCIRGYEMLLEFSRAHGIEHDICGKIILAVKESELPTLENIFDHGTKNGLKGMQWLGPEAIREREPNVRGVKAIYVPQSGIIDYKAVARKLAEQLEKGGTEFKFGHAVTGIEERGGNVVIETERGEIETAQLITCGGLYADKLAEMTGTKLNCKIVPFRGEYYKFTDEHKHLVNHLIYPVPDVNFPFLGVHFTRMINGDIEAGPNAVLAFAREGYTLGTVNSRELVESLTYPGFQKLAWKHMRKGMDEMHRSISKRAFIRELRKMMPGLKAEYMVKAGAGVRAQALNRDGTLLQDYYFYRSKRVLHVINAPSPAATSSLSIGAYIVDMLETE